MALTDSLEIYHRFRGGIGASEDFSGNSRELVEVGTQTTHGRGGKDGRFDVAAYFTGTALHYLKRSADDAVFDFGGNDFTISLWVKFSTIAAERNLTEKFYGSTGPGWTLYKHTSHYLEFYHSGGLVLTGGPTLSADTWYHVVVRRSGTSWVLRVNNTNHATATSGASIANTSEPVRIGHRNETDGRHFPLAGLIDEYAIWSRALTDDEITEIYNSGNGKSLLDPKIVQAACPSPIGTTTVTRGWYSETGKLGAARRP